MSAQARPQIRLKDVLERQQRHALAHGTLDLLIAIAAEVGELIAEVRDVGRERRRGLKQGGEAGGGAPALGAVVEHERHDDRQQPRGVLATPLLPDPREVAQEIERDVGLGVALVLEEHIDIARLAVDAGHGI